MKRSIIRIDEEKCTGCAECIPNCPEGAIQIIDGKARLVSDLFCDGLGACIGNCPEGAISIEEREAEPYDESKVMARIVQGGPNVIRAHLAHLKEHDATQYYDEAVSYLRKHGYAVPALPAQAPACGGSCPGRAQKEMNPQSGDDTGHRRSKLTHWPVQLHLISPVAPYFSGADILLAADCVAFALGDFHKDYLEGKKLIIGCPKLDSNLDSYVEKIRRLIDEAKVNTITVMMMEVPCCSGLLSLVQKAASKAERKVPIKKIIVSIRGDQLREEWV
jgi:ferredoxin